MLNLRAVRLEPRRQDERFAEMRRILVGGEARTFGRNLEQHAAWLLEVHRLEPEAIDLLGGVTAGGDHLFADRMLMLVIVHAPGEMMHAADAPRAPRADRHFADVDDARGVWEAVARPAMLVAQSREAEGAREERDRRLDVALPELRAVQSANLALRRDRAAVPRRECPRRRALDERDLQSIPIAA